MRLRISIAVKLAVCLMAGAAAIFTGFGYLSLRLQRKQMEHTALETADRLVELVQHSTRKEMLHNDRYDLGELIKDIAGESAIRGVRIVSADGRTQFSSNPAEVGADPDPATRVWMRQPVRTRTMAMEQGERLLQIRLPIPNEAVCSNAACHAHPASEKVLGAIDLKLSLAHVDATVKDYQSRIVEAAAVAVLLVCLVSLLFAWLMIHRPVGELIQGTRRVAAGDHRHRLKVRTGDELGELADSFNTMNADLEKAHAELLNWTETLETRVAQKAGELQKAYESMAGAERLASLGKLAATVAHEVNNPLMGILTYARLSRKEIEKPQADRARVVEQLKTIEHESRRCGDLMRNLLMFARESPRRLQANDLNALVSRATTLIRHQLDLNGIELMQNLAAPPPEVVCDAGQIQQVVLGLLVNATDVMPKGGKLWVETSRDGELVTIRVRDNGPGIPPEVLPQIFDPFFTTKTDEQRTGLGLAVAKSIVEQHGGTIVAESKPGEGAEFIIRLRLEGVPAPPVSEPAMTRRA